MSIIDFSDNKEGLVKWSYLLNGSSKDLNVDGSSTTQNFTFTPSSDCDIISMNLLLTDVGTLEATDFGSISGPLTNGCNLQVKSLGNLYDLINLETNMDLVLFLQDIILPSGTSILDEDGIVGTVNISNKLYLTTSTSDFIRLQIRDDLRGLEHFRFAIKYLERI